MSSSVPISAPGITAPTPQNTPLQRGGPITLGLSRPTVPIISEDGEDGSDVPMDGTDDPLAGLQQHMVGMVQSRLAGLVGKSSGYIEALPVDVKLNVEALKGIQLQYYELENKYRLECLALERKYHELHKPMYERRHAIITGTSLATSEEIAAGEATSRKDDEAYIALPKDVSPSSEGIPEFWLTALRNHIGLAEIITERDAAALKHLIDVRIEHINVEDADEKQGDADEKQSKQGYKIIFEFTANDFFENKILEKSYFYGAEVNYSGVVYDHASGTTIQWKEDKDLTKEFEIKKQRNKNTNRTRLVRKVKPVDSFFNFFSPPTRPSEEPEEESEEDAELEERIEVDYTIGEDLKEKVIPRAIDYFTGKALEDEVDEDDEFDEDDDDDNNDQDDDTSGSGSDQDDSESDGYVAGHGGGGRGEIPQKVRHSTSSNPEECKQQ